MASLRLERGAKLAKLKALLCRQGRKGKWKAFVEEKAIPPRHRRHLREKI